MEIKPLLFIEKKAFSFGYLEFLEWLILRKLNGKGLYPYDITAREFFSDIGVDARVIEIGERCVTIYLKCLVQTCILKSVWFGKFVNIVGVGSVIGQEDSHFSLLIDVIKGYGKRESLVKHFISKGNVLVYESGKTYEYSDSYIYGDIE